MISGWGKRMTLGLNAGRGENQQTRPPRATRRTFWLRLAGIAVGIAMIAWPFGASAEIVYPVRHLGSIEAVFTESKIDIKRGPRQWHLDLAHLIRGVDCLQPYATAGTVCKGPSKMPCPNCPHESPYDVAWDEAHQWLFFAIPFPAGWERPITIFRYSLVTGRASPLVSTGSGAIGRGGVSKSGRYLAYAKVHHTAPAGGCNFESRLFSDVEIVDLWQLKIANPPLGFPQSSDVFFLDRIEWSGLSSLSYILNRHGRDCVKIAGQPPLRLQVDVNALQFH